MSIFKKPDGYKKKNPEVSSQNPEDTEMIICNDQVWVKSPAQVDPSFCAVFESREEYEKYIQKEYKEVYEEWMEQLVCQLKSDKLKKPPD